MKFSTLPRIYTTSSIEKNQTINFTSNELCRLKIVLRMKIGRKFRVFNRIDGEYYAEVKKIGDNELTAEVGELIRKVIPQYKLTLAMCIIKPDKIAQALRSATELGISDFIPIISDRTQFKSTNLDKLKKIAIQAVEQSERFDPPVINKPMSLNQLIETKKNRFIIFANEEESDRMIKDIEKRHGDMILLIGPEGGFTSEEKQRLIALDNSVSVSLGKSVLRSETAALAGLAFLNILKG